MVIWVIKTLFVQFCDFLPPLLNLFCFYQVLAVSVLYCGHLCMNTGVGCHFLLQGILLIQGSNPHLLHWQADSLPLSHQGSPIVEVRGRVITVVGKGQMRKSASQQVKKRKFFLVGKGAIEDLFIILFTYLFLAVLALCGQVGSFLLAASGGCCSLQCKGFSLWQFLFVQSVGSRARGLMCLVVAAPRLQSPWAQQLWCRGLVVPQHVASSQIRDQTCISCIGKWILYR